MMDEVMLMLVMVVELTSTLTLILMLISVLIRSWVIPCDGERAEHADGDSRSGAVKNEGNPMNMHTMAHFYLR